MILPRGTVHSISVRDLSELVNKSGSMDGGFFSNERALDGTRGHKKVQKSRGELFEKEVSLKYEWEKEGLRLKLEGRMDLFSPGHPALIEEIKTTDDKTPDSWGDSPGSHRNQVKSYGALHFLHTEDSEVLLKLTYFHLHNESELSFEKKYTRSELLDYLNMMVERYFEYWSFLRKAELERFESLKNLHFPYGDFRTYQKALSATVYRRIKAGENLFLEAPTGTGKTMGTMFPAIRSLGDETIDRILFTTARTVGRNAAEEAVKDIKKAGGRIFSVSLTAKDKICFNFGSSCTPEDCEYTEGYYDRIDNALKDAVSTELLDRDGIEELAEKHKVCPFEFSLDSALISDLVICDYNYIFDPSVSMKRYFENRKENYLLLLDEAHNLPDRARDMYTEILSKKEIMDLRRLTKKNEVAVHRSLSGINNQINRIKKEAPDNRESYDITDPDEKLVKAIKRFIENAELFFRTGDGTETVKQRLLEFYFNLRRYIRLCDENIEGITTLYKKEDNDFTITRLCLDPAPSLESYWKRFHSYILFTATLTPQVYFQETLFTDKCPDVELIPSPFPKDNCLVIVRDDIDTRYRFRERSMDSVVKSILETVKLKKGNYMVFFPSYNYLDKVYFHLNNSEYDGEIIAQEPEMSEEERAEFLQSFEDSRNILALAVLGGIFGEGIDLRGDKLIGVIIVGVGLPGISVERELYMKGYKEQGKDGFACAYRYPGFNRIMQAAGRVIRTETDKGIITLLDSRYSNNQYKPLFPHIWRDAWVCHDQDNMIKLINNFWD